MITPWNELVTIKDPTAAPEIKNDRYILRDVRDTVYGIRGRCGNVQTAFTFATDLWYWYGGFYGYLNRSVERASTTVHRMVTP